MHKTTIEMKMQYAIINFIFTAAVMCEVDEFISPDTAPDASPDISEVKDLDELTKAIRENIPLGYDSPYSHEIKHIGSRVEAELEETTSTQTTTMIANNELFSNLTGSLSKDISSKLLNDDHESHEIGDFKGPVTKADDSFLSLRELVSKDISIKNTPVLRSQQTALTDAKIDKKKTYLEDFFKETAVVDSIVGFDEIKNINANTVEAKNKTHDTGHSGLTEEGLSSDRNVLTPKFLKVDESNGAMQFSFVDKASDISRSNPRKVFFANSTVENGTDLLSLQGEINLGYVNPMSGDKKEYRANDFSKSTFVGVPMNLLLTMLRSKTNTDEGNENISNVRSILHAPTDLTNGVVDFIKGSARNIGDIIFNSKH